MAVGKMPYAKCGRELWVKCVVNHIEYRDIGGILYHIHIAIITAQTNSIFRTTLVNPKYSISKYAQAY